MKKYIISLLTVVAACICTGCSDYLDKQPDDMKTETMVWTNRTQVEAYLANCYNALPYKRLHQDDPWIGMADECDIPWTVYPLYAVNLGNWSPTTGFYNKYGLWYKAIRATLTLEKNIDRCMELSADLKIQYKAEAKFLRGYYYYLLVRQYGPVVLVKEVMPDDADYNALVRAPFDECTDYICQMFDEASEDLPLHYQNNTGWLGRPNKIVCKAAKSVMLVMAASPMWNGNAFYADFKNPDGTALVNTTYSVEKWRKAAEASREVIDLAEHNPDANLKLYRNDENGDKVFNPFKSCTDVQLKNWNCEIIFSRTWDSALTSFMIHSFPGPKTLGGVGATQRIVDAFLMENGKPIDDPESGYKEEGFSTTPNAHWNPNNRNIATENGRKDMIADMRNSDAWGHWAGEWNMFCNREPRFYASIMYNKRVLTALPDDKAKRNFFNAPGQQDGFGHVELYYGGTSYQAGAYTFFPQTGMLVHKYMDPQANMYDRVWPQKYGSVFIRYAEILLNYIEALNEYDPANPDIRKYWDQIRSRAGVPSAFVATPQIAGNKELQLDYILRERQIELCFEGDRYFTTRRRWLSHTPDLGGAVDNRKFGDGGRMWGMNINAGDPKTNSFANTDFYKRKDFETRVFNMSYYLFPLPQSEVEKCKNVVQNPEW